MKSMEGSPMHKLFYQSCLSKSNATFASGLYRFKVLRPKFPSQFMTYFAGGYHIAFIIHRSAPVPGDQVIHPHGPVIIKGLQQVLNPGANINGYPWVMLSMGD